MKDQEILGSSTLTKNLSVYMGLHQKKTNVLCWSGHISIIWTLTKGQKLPLQFVNFIMSNTLQGRRVSIQWALECETNQSFMIDRNLTTRGFPIMWRWISCCKSSLIFWKVVSSLRLEWYSMYIFVWFGPGFAQWFEHRHGKKNILKGNHLREDTTSICILFSLQIISCKAHS